MKDSNTWRIKNKKVNPGNAAMYFFKSFQTKRDPVEVKWTPYVRRQSCDCVWTEVARGGSTEYQKEESNMESSKTLAKTPLGYAADSD